MTTRPSLLRSIPFWLLIVGSLATVVYGAWLFIVTTGSIATGLEAQTATSGDVYVGPSFALLGAILVGAGLIGLALALVLAVLRSLLPVPAVEIVEEIDWAAEDEPVVETTTTPAEAVVAAPVVAEPVAEKPVDEAPTTR